MDFCLLSKFDDLFSDIFLDAQFLWFDTIKLNTDHRRPRIRSDKVLKIIQDKVLTTGKTNEAVKELLRMDYFKHYLATKSAKQQQEFIQHMKRYLYMYMPNAGFEVADTRRYGGAGRRVEACVTVTKDWKTGDEMRLCTGMIAHLEPHQEHELKKGNRDISVMWSTRKQCNCLFLGPARFVNHDCDPNAKFISLGPNSVTFKIIKDINCGDELTAFYGKHYFGENNCECRCATCETKQSGYFASEEYDDEESALSEKEKDPGYRRSSRKRKSTLHDSCIEHDTNRNKRASTIHQIELEQLIDDLDNKEDDNTPLIKQEPVDDERPKVMSIDFLCNENDKQQHQVYPTTSHSPLDLLCNAVLDAEYLGVRKQDITVVVSSDIHRDATDRVMRMNNQLDEQQHWPSMDDEDATSDTKADSAVGLSPDQDVYHQKRTPPPLSTNIIETTNNKTTQWQDGMGSLFDNEQLSDLDDFMDDVSDLSSVCSSDSALESISSDNDDNFGQLSTPSPSPINSKKQSSTSHPKHLPRKTSLSSLSTISSTSDTNHTSKTKGLDCMACGRTLNSEMATDPSAADVAVANELATWTWSPSAAFTDWRPQRCPRCERHVRVFNQEWPSRKIIKVDDATEPPPTKKVTPKRSHVKKQHKANQYINSFKPGRKQYLRSPPTPTSEIFDGVGHLF